jgi:hypothetical protein
MRVRLAPCTRSGGFRFSCVSLRSSSPRASLSLFGLLSMLQQSGAHAQHGAPLAAPTGVRRQRHRARKFCVKRHPYQRYASAPFKRDELVKTVLARQGEHGALAQVAREHHVPRKTLCNWVRTYQGLLVRASDRVFPFMRSSCSSGPLLQATAAGDAKELLDDGEEDMDDPAAVLAGAALNAESRGGSNRALSHSEEEDLYNFLCDCYVDAGLPLDDADISRLASEKWAALHPAGPLTRAAAAAQPVKPTFSHGWVSEFKKAWRLSTRRPASCKATSSSSTALQTEANFFRFTCADLFDDYGPTRVYNVDEMRMPSVAPDISANPKDHWCVFLAGLYQCQSHLGCIPLRCTCSGHTNQPRVKLITPGNAKEGFTAYLAARMDGRMLPALAIAKGKTAQSEKKFEAARFPKEIKMTHAPSGWTTETVQIKMLQDIIGKDSKARAAVVTCCSPHDALAPFSP